ncbi:hypothetical protein PCASD_11813 [Puccinia coronata f. sp. avenae]|uniref:Uncharacterized protein n=1 Tax=Puccinia coronata f. sp. avenae TaxID=200324 RepID=A0A2N5UK10_9BASI|nr:hypothetical protein PCASD_11813 [Puccinia coronata f. sp. avenae]
MPSIHGLGHLSPDREQQHSKPVQEHQSSEGYQRLPISTSDSPESYIVTRPFLQNYEKSIFQSLLQLAATKPMLPMDLRELLVDGHLKPSGLFCVHWTKPSCFAARNRKLLVGIIQRRSAKFDSAVFHQTTPLFSWFKPLVYPSPSSLLTELLVLYITVAHSRSKKDLFLEGLPRATYLEERKKLPDSLSNQQIASVYSSMFANDETQILDDLPRILDLGPLNRSANQEHIFEYLLIKRHKAPVTSVEVLTSANLAVQPMKRNNKPLPETSCESSYHTLSSKLDWTKQSPPPQPVNSIAFSALNFASHEAPLYTSIIWIPNRNQADNQPQTRSPNEQSKPQPSSPSGVQQPFQRLQTSETPPLRVIAA